MKALSVQHFWAWAIIQGHKRVENRTWPTNHRGVLAIHAGQRIDPHSREVLEGIGLEIPQDVPRGVILGTVELIDVVRFDRAQGQLGGFADPHGLAEDPLATGPYCWILRNPRPLPEPVPCRGERGLFDVEL